MIKANGEELQGRLTDLTMDSHNEDQVMLTFKGSKYLMRVNSLDVDEETGRYLHMDLLFAALNPHTEGIYIKGDAPTPKISAKEKKKA